MKGGESVRIDILGGRYRNLAPFLRRSGERILRAMGIREKNLEISLISERDMKVLNRKFRGKNTSTNVLSFPVSGKFVFPKNHSQLGEVCLSPSYVKKEAHGRSYRDPVFKDRLRYLLLHGILHLLGYAHEKKHDRIKMEAREFAILKKISTHNY